MKDSKLLTVIRIFAAVIFFMSVMMGGYLMALLTFVIMAFTDIRTVHVLKMKKHDLNVIERNFVIWFVFTIFAFSFLPKWIFIGIYISVFIREMFSFVYYLDNENLFRGMKEDDMIELWTKITPKTFVYMIAAAFLLLSQIWSNIIIQAFAYFVLGIGFMITVSELTQNIIRYVKFKKKMKCID